MELRPPAGDSINDGAAPETEVLCDGELVVPTDYYCGKLLSGIWYDLRLQLENYSWGPGAQADSALDYARRLFVSWTMIAAVLDTTAATGGLPVANDLTAITVLTVDDAIDFDEDGNSIGGDGIVSNGTPHETAICNAFQELHGVPCGSSNVLAYPLGSRYIAIEASAVGGDPNAEIAFRVVGRATTNPDDPELSCIAPSEPGYFVRGDGTISSDIPVEFKLPGDWGDVVVRDRRIAPEGSYEIQVYQHDGQQPVFTGIRQAVRTNAWGDLTGDSQIQVEPPTNLDDILCMLAAFANSGGCPRLAGDLYPPCEPNGLVNLDDILAILSAFGGFRATFVGASATCCPACAGSNPACCEDCCPSCADSTTCCARPGGCPGACE